MPAGVPADQPAGHGDKPRAWFADGSGCWASPNQGSVPKRWRRGRARPGEGHCAEKGYASWWWSGPGGNRLADRGQGRLRRTRVGRRERTPGHPQERLSGQDDRPWVSPSPSTPRSDLQGQRPLPRAHPARSGARPAPRWPLVGGDCPALPLPGAALPTLDRQVCRLRLCPSCLRPLPGPSKPQGQPASGQGRAHSTRRPRRGPSPKAGGLWEGPGP